GSRVGIRIEEEKVPVKETVRAACELMGLDPLYIANEGKVLAAVAPGDADRILERMRRHPLGLRAEIIGEVVEDHPGRTVMKTQIGTSRIVDMLTGELLPRIC
ncbi:MAG: hydrogenase expression/formation protein HypE, partial [Deltaproteobacteria bacterium]|nr:hydrogenase expression/formation protein HypE [Deltaproteobacteria bacterium]